jgi:hypothetical protein
VAGACDFNGLEATRPTMLYVWSECAVDAVCGMARAAAGEEDGPSAAENADAGLSAPAAAPQQQL